ncbi:ribonuclease R [Dinghuibacter silviterrae]|uniref:Ribonuclease R n=1 Tax=Dinghuibacter silviterrae TaxID=1539049 RepID=A0A4R8DIJ2_9BACT|nr:ribonuclease R [Dinghuibacter silviterrae]TDW97569.1 ribonuclease R [Dinghuibacter silviterrae]
MNKKKKNTTNTYKGTLDIARSGIGYVIVEGLERDILVRPTEFNTAFHGDTVRVEVTSAKAGGRTEGRIAEVLERKQTEFIGRLDIRQQAFFVPDGQKPIPDFFIPSEHLGGASNGDRVVVRMTSWNKGERKPVGEVIAILNPEDANDMAMKELLLEKGFPLEFGDEVLEQALRLPDTISAEEVKRRRDFRPVLTFTIDPVDAKDFDDALSFRRVKKDLYEIGVHIADVSHFVEPDTDLDKSAYQRATSVYLPDRVLPMLPERISNELCSLRPHEDKYTFAAVFQINAKGEIKDTWLGKTLIHSDHRFTYEEVQEVIETKDGPHAEEVLLLNKLAQQFRKKRLEHGAINFSSVEVRFILDERGKPTGIVIKESKEAHQLIEEFMLLANKAVAEAVAKYKIDGEPVPFPYRVHDTPDEEKLKPFAAFAAKYGHKFDVSSPDAIASSFNSMLRDVQGRPEQHVLEQLGIRTMAKAIYATEDIGHYGLGFDHYCHFTSPIRRYPDVMVHRILERCLQGHPPLDKKMDQKCRHTSERERAAMETERAANKYKQVEYMRQFLGDTFEGVISGVASFGFWVELVATKCEGLVSLNSLLDFDEFLHIEEDYCLTGRRSGRTFRMGDKVHVRVVAANLDKRQLDYEWAPSEAEAAEGVGAPAGARRLSAGHAGGARGGASRFGGARGGGKPRHDGGGGRPGGGRDKSAKPARDGAKRSGTGGDKAAKPARDSGKKGKTHYPDGPTGPGGITGSKKSKKGKKKGK